MKISTKGRYGLRAMADLAVSSMGEHISLKSIAERQSISENYLEQVFSTLRKGGLVKSVKGPQGGYQLAADAASITVGSILRTLEGKLILADESSEGSNIMEKCIEEVVWNKLNESINTVADSISLEDIASIFKSRYKEESFMYYI